MCRAKEDVLNFLSKNAWTKTGPYSFVLNLGTPQLGHVTVAAVQEGSEADGAQMQSALPPRAYECTQTYRIPNGFVTRSRKLPIEASTVDEAVRAVDVSAPLRCAAQGH